VILLGFLRYGIGADYGNYLMSYQYYATGETFGLGVNNHNFNLEPFFQLVAKVSYELTNSPILFFGITWGLMVLLIFFGIKKLLPSVDSKNFSLVWLLSISLITPFAFDQIRQTLAMAIFFFSIRYIIDKKFIKYAFMAVLASTVHISAIFVMVISYVLGRWILRKKDVRRIKKSLRRLYFFITSLIFSLYIVTILNVDFLTGTGLSYVDEMLRLLHDSGAIKIGIDEIVPLLLLVIPTLVLAKTIKKYSGVSAITHLFLTVGAAIAPLSLFISLGGRLSQYFLLLVPISVYLIVSLRQLKNFGRRRTTILINPYTIASLAFLFILAFTGWTRMIPYVSIYNSNAIVDSGGEPAPFYALLCDLGIKNNCSKEYNKIQGDSRIWRP